jgi:hypothetical protein
VDTIIHLLNKNWIIVKRNGINLMISLFKKLIIKKYKKMDLVEIRKMQRINMKNMKRIEMHIFYFMRRKI